MNLVLSILYAIWFFAVAALLVPIASALSVWSLMFDPQKKLLNRVTAFYMYRVCVISPFWKFHYYGLENLREDGPFIIVANHQSFADIVVLHGLPTPFRWVSKQSVFNVPFLGWNMYLNGHVPIHRGDIGSTRKMLKRCADLLQSGVSLFMFPEGTRSANGEVGAFRDGPFRLAKQTNAKVIPVAVHGTRDILAKGAPALSFRARVDVEVLPAVTVAEFDGDANRLRDHVEALIRRRVSARAAAPSGSAAPVLAG